MSGATTELHSLLITILNREFSSSNLESIFKVSHYFDVPKPNCM